MSADSSTHVLRLVSRGNSIIAEVLRLAEFVPEEFLLEARDDKAKYASILVDFSYFKTPEYYDNKIEKDPELLERAEEFQARNMDILSRFYLLFESIYKYVKDLTRFVDDLEEGVFIQQSLESLMNTTDGKQLLTEAVFLYGVMLLVLDSRIDGIIRERILVAYHRWKGIQAANSNMDEVCKLCRSTGLSIKAGKRPSNYPEEYFKRYPLPSKYVSIVIGRLRTDDIYNQTSSYPLQEHRSTALATQATMLYIILNFVPDILHNDQPKMREIVDRHFPDNWVIAYYMGVVVDLSEAWDSFKAAKLALSNTLLPQNLKKLGDTYHANAIKLIQELDNYLQEGVLYDDFVLDNTQKLLAFLKECNVTLRWILLHFMEAHTTTRSKKIKEMMGACSNFDDSITVRLLLSTAQFEYRLRNMFTSLMGRKQESWNEYKRQASERMSELAEYFSGEKALTRVTRNENLQNWFADIASKINALEFVNATLAGRKIVQLVQALEEVQEFHQLESNLQIKAFIADTSKYLYQMMRTINIREEVLVMIQLVSDLSYAWETIIKYIPLMQGSIKANPGNVIKLRATFLKLASILDLPLVRINQANSRDLVSVSEYYSGRLVDFVRQVLQIIPASMFSLLNEIVDAQTNKLREVPTRLEKEKLKEFAQLDERYELAMKTHAISVFTEGMLAMERTLVGVVEVDPKQLLEDGIRRELVYQLSSTMDNTLVFGKTKNDDFETRVNLLATKLHGFRRSFEYIQDYVNIYALKIWQEELSRIVNYHVERECNSFLKIKTQDWESIYQSTTIPIPQFASLDDNSINYMGRLAREILNITNPNKTIFVEQRNTWYDSKTFKEVFSFDNIAQIFEALGAYGLSGLDRLFSFMTVQKLQNFTDAYRKQIKADRNLKTFLDSFVAELGPSTTMPPGAAKQYPVAISKIGKFAVLVTDFLVDVGQIQIIRRLIASELRLRSKMDSRSLADSLDVMNRSLLLDIQNHYRKPDSYPYPQEDNLLLFELANYLQSAGINDPLLKIYITTEPLQLLAHVVFLVVLSQLPKFTYDPRISSLVSKSRSEGQDFIPFVLAILTLMTQFHSSTLDTLLGLIGQYVRVHINLQASGSQKSFALPAEAALATLFLETMGIFRPSVADTLSAHIPAGVAALARMT